MAGIRRGRVVAFERPTAAGPDRTVVVAEPSATVPAGDLTDAIRRRIVDLCGLVVDEVVPCRAARWRGPRAARSAVRHQDDVRSSLWSLNVE